MRSGNRSNDQGAGGEPPAKRSFIEEARRTQIIEAATETIAELGYGKASFAKIAEHAGISPSLISYHFASKKALLAAVNEAVIGAMEVALTAAAEGGRSYVDVIGRMVREFVRFSATRRVEMFAIHEIAMAASSPGEVDDILNRGASDDWAELLVEGQRAGEFRDFDVPTMSHALMAILESVPGRLYANPDADPELIANELATTVELAVAKKRRRIR